MQDKVKLWLTLTQEVKRMLKSGEVKEWTHYAGESGGYVIMEGSETDLLKLEGTFIPYVKWTTKDLLTIEQCETVWKSMLG
jgi:hypothetical protein